MWYSKNEVAHFVILRQRRHESKRNKVFCEEGKFTWKMKARVEDLKTYEIDLIYTIESFKWL